MNVISLHSNQSEHRFKISYMNCCVRAFAKRFGLSVKSAFQYLFHFKGIEFLDKYYETEHLQSIDDAVDDLVVLCYNNGGKIQ